MSREHDCRLRTCRCPPTAAPVSTSAATATPRHGQSDCASFPAISQADSPTHTVWLAGHHGKAEQQHLVAGSDARKTWNYAPPLVMDHGRNAQRASSRTGRFPLLIRLPGHDPDEPPVPAPALFQGVALAMSHGLSSLAWSTRLTRMVSVPVPDDFGQGKGRGDDIEQADGEEGTATCRRMSTVTHSPRRCTSLAHYRCSDSQACTSGTRFCSRVRCPSSSRSQAWAPGMCA